MANYTGKDAYPLKPKFGTLMDQIEIHKSSGGIARGGTDEPYNASARGLEKRKDERTS